MSEIVFTSLARTSVAALLAAALTHCADGERALDLLASTRSSAGDAPSADGVDTPAVEVSGSAPAASSADPECATGIVAGTACCAASCGECGGAGCSQRPGGTDGCCTGRINASGISCEDSAPPCVLGEPLPAADPECATGIVAGTACCAASCGECGGAGCSQRPGGTDGCCTGRINASGVSCEDSGPPCTLAP